jgi:ankyrin repeat protein
MEKELFKLIKNKDFTKIKKILLSKKKLNLNIKDVNNNYLINYLINYNEFNLIKIILEKHDVRSDILDTDGRNILYNPIKYNNLKLFNIIIKNDNNNIGISIIDKKDKLGNNSLQYCCILNNLEMFKILLNKGADPLILNNDNKNTYEICVDYNRNDILLYLLKNTRNFNIKNIKLENLIQIVLHNNNSKIIDYILSQNININSQDNDGFTALHIATILKNNIVIEKLIDNGANINIQDLTGNTAYHIAIIENNIKLINYFNNLDFNYNSTNITGDTILHLFLENNIISSTKIDYNKQNEYNILLKLIKNTNLNIQNNNGDTCIIYLIKKYLLEYKEIISILKQKKLNIFVENINNETPYSMFLNKNKLINIVSESFYYLLQKNKNNILLNWEKNCSNQDYENIKNTKNKIKCIEKIKKIIIKDKKCFPEFMINKIVLDNGIYVNRCSYTGSNIDVLFGLVWLKENFNYITLCLDYPLSYEKNNIYDFINIEIIWRFQKIIFPTTFNNFIKNIKNDTKYIILPIGIETSIGSHANIIFWDYQNKTIERFEPHGANHPIGLNYNQKLMDSILENKFKQIDTNIKYYRPNDYLPTIGLQSIESYETKQCKKIGDPNGFCAIWCTWWCYYKLKNNNIKSSKLINDLINMIKLKNIKFKTTIRNFSKNITDIRDNYLKKYKIDINDWILGNYNNNIIKDLEKDIYLLVQD